MAAPTNKLSSSTIASRANPNPRSSEIGNPMRRSFTGNPFSKPSIIPNPRGLNPNTPANSPSELPRRNSSVSRESVVTLLDNEDNKENGKMAKLRSPMGSKGSGTKNFMSPTISAASKINASPRKRILEERNEPVRSSISFSEVKIASFSPTISDSSNHKKEEEEEEEIVAAPPVSADLKAVSDSKPKKVVFVEPELVNLEPTFKISPPPPALCSSSPSIPVIAPLDSDPLAPPYDPKTNYLSPRPRFLHYKPNPRVELYLSKTKEGKRLEESFASGSFSDSDVTEEEEETRSEFLPEELEDDISSGEEVRAEDKEEEDEEKELIVSEPSPVDAVISKETVEAKTEFEPPRSVWRSKLTTLLIILSVVCVSISVANLAMIDHSVFDGTPAVLKQYDQPEILEFAKASFDEIRQRFHVWYANSISSFSELISNLREAHKVEPLRYFNLTALAEDSVPFDDFEMNEFVSTREKGEFHIGGAEIIVEDKALQIDAEYEEQVHQKADEASFEVEETPEIRFSPDSFDVGQAPSAELLEPESSGDFEDDPFPILQADEAQSEVQEEVDASSGAEMTEVPEAEVPREEVDVSSGAEMEAAIDDISSSETPEVDVSSEGTKGSEEVVRVIGDESREHSFSKVNVLGIALSVLALIASTSFVFVKKGKSNSTLNASDVNIKGQGSVNKKLDSSPALYKPGNTFEVRDFSGESCPSEMSSYQNTSSYNNKKGLNSHNEAQSHERKAKKNQRRESMASSSMDSSMGSPSYGSFTTYEKIPTKYGHGDEEVITPVRRSSRLRSHVTSP